MQSLLKRPGYRLYAADSPEARALLAEQGLSPADLDRALARLERAESTAVRTIVGINEDGVFGTSREGWRPDLPDACREPFIPLLRRGLAPGGDLFVAPTAASRIERHGREAHTYTSNLRPPRRSAMPIAP